MTAHYHRALTQKLTQQLNVSTSVMHHIFSYTLTYDSAPLTFGLTLQQEETGYTLSMTMHRDTLGLRVYQFNLQKDDVLAEYCAPLYDAALIDLVLQALNLLFHCADYWKQPQITCAFPPDEAEHILYFDRFFSDLAYGANTSRVQIPALEQDYQEFCVRTHEIQRQIHQTLWKLQKTDRYLRRFLQTPEVRQNLKSQVILSSPTSVIGCANGTVLTFPRSASRK